MIQVLARWIRLDLDMVGISRQFIAHSTRLSSSSAAAKFLLLINEILITVGWSNEKKKHWLNLIGKKLWKSTALTI